MIIAAFCMKFLRRYRFVGRSFFLRSSTKNITQLLIVAGILATFMWSWDHGVNGKFIQEPIHHNADIHPFVSSSSIKSNDRNQQPYLRKTSDMDINFNPINERGVVTENLSSMTQSIPRTSLSPPLKHPSFPPLPILDKTHLEHVPSQENDNTHISDTISLSTSIASTYSPPPPPPPLPLPEQSIWQNSKESLISEGMPASSDVRGNLGPASTITSEIVNDWLKDRWQAAKNMKGQPIPGKHWVEIDMKRTCIPSRFLIDWETAFGKDYEIMGKTPEKGEWVPLYSTSKNKGFNSKVKISTKKQHVIHEFPAQDIHQEITAVRLNILRAGTQWGVSVWRFQVWGVCDS